MKLSKLHSIYRRWLHIEDTKRIDVVLAAALTNKMEGTPIWLILVGPSGDWKSEQLLALNGSDSFILDRLTDRTLVTGHDDPSFDLVPKINGKILIISDMAAILKLHPNIKAEVWAQLRNLYDGRISNASGMMRQPREYIGVRVTLLAGSTTAIDHQIMIYQELGTRELLWRTAESVEKEKLMDKVWKNEQYEAAMKKALAAATHTFLADKKPRKIKFSAYISNYLKYKAMFLTKMRAPAASDSYTGELLSAVNPEEPTRLLKQLKRLFIALKSLDDNYDTDRALAVIDHLVDSSADQIRLRVWRLLQHSDRLTTSQIAEKLRLGKRTVFSQLAALWNMSEVRREDFYDQQYPERLLKSEWWIEEAKK